MGEKGSIRDSRRQPERAKLRKRVDGVKQAIAKYPNMKVVDTFYHVETAAGRRGEVIRVQNAYPQIQGWAMIGGWPLFTTTLLTDLDPKKVKIVAVDGLPAELAYVEKGLAPVLLHSRPTSGATSR
jgi:ribose transport system substrate-binding protein